MFVNTYIIVFPWLEVKTYYSCENNRIRINVDPDLSTPTFESFQNKQLAYHPLLPLFLYCDVTAAACRQQSHNIPFLTEWNNNNNNQPSVSSEPNRTWSGWKIKSPAFDLPTFPFCHCQCDKLNYFLLLSSSSSVIVWQFINIKGNCWDSGCYALLFSIEERLRNKVKLNDCYY